MREGESMSMRKIRKRETRRLDAMFHRIDEMERDRATGADRKGWNRKKRKDEGTYSRN